MKYGAPRLMSALDRIAKDPDMLAGVKAMDSRAAEFASPLAARIAGAAAHPASRAHLEAEMDKTWEQRSKVAPRRTYDEIVIGGGLHAAIYSAVRVARGFPKPLVLERDARVGGAFAVSREPSFFLNSRNRPGSLSVPGRPGALNVIPGAPVQPADLSGDEYQRNSDLALAIRLTLAMHADVRVGLKVTSIARIRGDRWTVRTTEGNMSARRVVVATGIGTARGASEHPRILTFPEFMAAMDAPFPLRGMERVAVVGAGDSGRTAVEALLGQGPRTGWSVASLDWVDRIDWYGLRADSAYRAGWENCNRSRYRGIGRALPISVGGAEARIMPITERASVVSGGFRQATVNDRPYDYVVVCSGYDASIDAPVTPWGDSAGLAAYTVDERPVARRYDTANSAVVVGPAARLEVTNAEREYAPQVSAVPENATSLFRYAGRTAALAYALPDPEAYVAPVPF